MTDEIVTITEIRDVATEKEPLWRIRLSNHMHLWLGLKSTLLPPVGTEIVLAYPNNDDVLVHLPVGGRVRVFTFKRGYFCF